MQRDYICSPLSDDSEMKSLLQNMVKAGIPEDLAQEQLRLIQRGISYADLHSSASIGNGILDLSKSELDRLISIYDDRSPDVKILKFVPASGAATRMFKELMSAWKSGLISTETERFFESVNVFPFMDKVPSSISRMEILETILSEKMLNLDNLPKGSIEFHRYKSASRTAFEEHLVEGVDYATSGGKVHIHFTISPNHMDQIKRDMTGWKKIYGERLNCDYDLQFSVQRTSTDTVPFDEDLEPLVEVSGRLMTRPGGHGALIHNLNELKADIIFIKNVDNVVTDEKRTDTIVYKKALAGLLIQVRNEARRIISLLKAEDSIETKEMATEFLKEMGTDLKTEKEVEDLIRLMNRPYRVCGMVKNQGESGGGPFWVKGEDRVSLQIVESAQIDQSNASHTDMLNEGTHFNPVDIVCSLNDLYGMKLDLLEYVDKDAAFVTKKDIDGLSAKVIEWPGLWNGAMADWNTIFVQVPISTFNPVKTVNDLLRPMHR